MNFYTKHMKQCQAMHFYLYRTTIFVFVMLGVCLSWHAEAGREVYNVREAGGNVRAGLQLQVDDDKYGYMLSNVNWRNEFDNFSTHNKVTLAIDPYGSSVMNEAFSIYATVEITYMKWDQTTNTFVSGLAPTGCTGYEKRA